MRLFKIIVWSIAGFSLSCVVSYAQQQRYFYDSNGNNVGSSMAAGQNTFFYDGQGNNIGSAMKAGKNTFYYDAQGNSVGSSIPSGIDAE